MPNIQLDVSHLQGRIVVLDSEDAPTQATVPFTLVVGIDQVRLIIGGEDGVDVLVRKYTNRTSFVVHPDEGDPVAIVEIKDKQASDVIGKVSVDAERMSIDKECP